MAALRPAHRRRQGGQSMTEYMVVVVWGILLLYNDPLMDAVTDLVDVMKDHYRGRIYSLSLSDPPQADSLEEYLTILAEKKIDEQKEELHTFIDNAPEELASYISDTVVGYAEEKIGEALEEKIDELTENLDLEKQLTQLWSTPAGGLNFDCSP